jgi:hypothetical protein
MTPFKLDSVDYFEGGMISCPILQEVWTIEYFIGSPLHLHTAVTIGREFAAMQRLRGRTGSFEAIRAFVELMRRSSIEVTLSEEG